MLIKANIGSITDPKKNEIIDNKVTLQNVIEDYHFDTTNGVVTIDGTPVNKNEFDKTLEELGVVEGSYVTFSIKNGGNR